MPPCEHVHNNPTTRASRSRPIVIKITEPRKEVRTMAKKSSSSGSSKSGSSSDAVSSARLHQKSGSSHAFGGYTKVNNSDGTFRMRKSGK